MFGRRKRDKDNKGGGLLGRGKDKAIVHQSVPPEVLAPTGPTEVADTSWMDEVPVAKKESSAAAAPKPKPAPKAAPAPAAKATPQASVNPISVATQGIVTVPANPAQSGERARFPYGWLVVVEGPGLGEWFPLARGVTDIGGGEDQTVSLDFGDPDIRPSRHAILAYDEGTHLFHVQGNDGTTMRVNGVVSNETSALRDGDVITIGGTSLRLVALCSPNFHWSKDLAAE